MTTAPTTSAVTTTVSGATTTVPVVQGDVAVSTTTSVAPGWRVVVDANFNGITPSNGGITFAPNSETAFRVFGPGTGFRSVEVSFGPSMVGKTVGLTPWDATVSAAISGAGTSSTVDATGKAVFALPTTPFGMLYFTGINAAAVTITGIAAKVAVVGGPPTTVVGGQADVAVATTTTVAAGWRVVVDANFNGIAPANGGITFTPNTETAFRVFGPGNGFRSVEVTFGPSMVGKTVGLAPWDATVSAAISGAGTSSTVDAAGKAIFSLPTTPFGMLYFTGVNAPSVTITGIIAKAAVVSGPPTTTPGTQTDLAIATTTSVAAGWRVVVDANFNGITPANGGITFAPNSETAFRVFGPGTGFRSVEVTFGPSMIGKTVGLAPWDATVSAAISGAGVTGIVDATGKAVFALPTAPFGMLYFTGVNAASVTITNITVKAAAVSGPPTTNPGTQTDLVVVTPTAVLAGWRVVADSNFNGLTPANGGISFAPNTENAFRLFGPGNGFGSVEVTFGPSMVGKTVGLAPWDATVNAAISGAGVTGVVASTGKAVFALPATPFGMLYFTGVNAASVTITGISVKTAGTGTGGNGTGGVVSPNPCPNRTGALRVWPIGDSLTVGGYGTGNYDGPTPFRDSYRYELFRLLGVNGYSNVQFRGDLGRAGGWGGNLPAGVSDEFSHSGYGGRDIPFMLDQVATLAAVGPVDPDLIILNIGHNGGTPDQLTALVARLQQIAPYAVIVVGGLAQSRPEITGTVSAERAALRAKAQALGAISTTDRVLFANVFAGMQQQTMVIGDYADDTHYNVTGGTKFATALLPTVLAGLAMVSGARCTPHATLVDGGTPVDPGTPLATDLNIVQTGPVAYATGFTSTPTLTSPTAPLALTIDGPAKLGARALRVDMNSTVPVKIQVSTQDGTRTFADFTVTAGNTIHSIPFTTPLGALPVRVTLTATGTYTLRAVTLFARPFITVTTNQTYPAGVSVPVTISGVWDPAITGRTFIRVQAATDPNSCTNCGPTAPVNAAGQTLFNTLTPGIYKAVLYTNTPGEVIGISPDFEILPEIAVPNGNQIVVYDDKLSDAFRNWSWATHNLDNQAPALGTRSISFEADNWKGLTFHADQISTAVRTLSIQINGGTAGGQQIVVAATSNQQTIASRQLTLTPGWQSVTLTFPAPVAAGSPIEVSIGAQTGNDQPTVYLDDIKLGTATPPPTTTGTLPPATTTTTRPPTTAVATTTRPATTAVATTRAATTTTRPATTIAGTTTRPATTTIAATTTRPPTTLAATTTRPPTTVATTTTIALTTTIASTTTVVVPPTTPRPTSYPGSNAMVAGFNTNNTPPTQGQTCYGQSGIPQYGTLIPSEAWNAGNLNATGLGYGLGTLTVNYTLNGVPGSIAPNIQVTANAAPTALPSIPSGGIVTSYLLVITQNCIPQGGDYKLEIFAVIPSWNGTTNPTTTTPGVTTTTIYQPPVTTTPPLPPRPAPFSSPANYFKTKYSDLTAPGQGACLARRAIDNVAALASCGDASRRGISFESSDFGDWKIHPTGDSSTCLRISRNPSGEYDTTNARNALKAEWGSCADPFSGNNYLDDKFTMVLRGDGWYWAKPAYNYAGWNQPCLSAHATAGTGNDGGTTGNIFADDTPVIQYECQPNVDWQQWAPAERDWTPSPPTCEQTNTCPQPPTGSHILQPNIATSLERATDLNCLLAGTGTTITIGLPADVGSCESYVPIQINGGWNLQLENTGLCLATNSLAVTTTPCSTQTIWDDQIAPDGLKFNLHQINPTTKQKTGLCLGGTTTPQLVTCNPTDGTQLWYDKAPVQGPINPAVVDLYADLVFTYTDIDLRAATASELFAVASFVNLPVRDRRLTASGPETGGWLLVTQGGMFFPRNIFSRGITGIPTDFVEKNGFVIRLQPDGSLIQTQTRSARAEEEWRYLLGIGLFFESQPPSVLLEVEERCGLSREDGKRSAYNDAAWDAAITGAIAEVGGKALATIRNRQFTAKPRNLPPIPSTIVQSLRQLPGGSVLANEQWTGHTLKRHVGYSDNGLIRRFGLMKTNGQLAYPNIKGSSSFKTAADAELFTLEAFQDIPQAGINAFMSSSKTYQSFDVASRNGLIVGRVVRNSTPETGFIVTDSRLVRVVLAKDVTAPDGFFVITSFPN